jgi:hypothetical protein
MCQWSEDVWFQAVVIQAYIAKYPFCSAKTSVIDAVYLNNLSNMAKYFHKFSLKIDIFLFHLIIKLVVQFDNGSCSQLCSFTPSPCPIRGFDRGIHIWVIL